mmetsp:Transcript_37849/g.103243  ORF Transcript_37849/g.103243 Transcript_37849/m.103243 type:complete len:335 (+) Transcript_37849:359-1363(+)
MRRHFDACFSDDMNAATRQVANEAADLLCDVCEHALHSPNESRLGQLLQTSVPGNPGGANSMQQTLRMIYDHLALCEDLEEAAAPPRQGQRYDTSGMPPMVFRQVLAVPEVKALLHLAFDEMLLKGHFSSSSRFFIDHMERIFAAGYEATEADRNILRFRPGGFQSNVEVRGCTMKISSAGDASERSRRQFRMLRLAMAVADAYVLVVDLTTYAQSLLEDEHQNAMISTIDNLQAMMRLAEIAENCHQIRLYIVFTHADLMEQMMAKIPVSSVLDLPKHGPGKPLWPDFNGTTAEDAARYFSDNIKSGSGASDCTVALRPCSACFKSVAPRCVL